MNPVNATALYVSACRSVLQCDPRDPKSFTELYKILPFFRQSLSCLVCGNLLQDPIAPTNSSCQHYVCKGCKGQKMMMKPSCSWCKDYEQFEGNRQLCILVDCYRKLCEYIAGSPLLQQIASGNGGSSDVLAMLKEGLSQSRTESEDYDISLSYSSPAPSTSDDPSDGQLEPFADIHEPPASSPCSNSINGLHSCNGLTAVEELVVGLPSPPEGDGDAGAGVKPCSFTDALQACEPAASDELITDGIEICGFSEDSKHPSGPLMLTVEEVLRTLEPDPEPEPGAESCSEAAQPKLEAPVNLNGSSDHPQRSVAAVASRPPAPSLGTPCSATTPHTTRPSRKRSRSESDSEKVQPLPISSIIQGPPLAAAALAADRQDVKVQVAQPLATVPNGGTLKVTKTLVTSSRGTKKNPDHIPRKAYSKAKQGVPKTKDKVKDRTPSSNSTGGLMSGSPTKAVHKKPQEKKGCKCGRATQNPSVLTCRGQRCPCYSNRKACLDCICRGCQNSYMANGEKKLEAFAVPEKALEQTRLTLGINVTSIAVRSAGTSAGVLGVAGGPPGASFLAGGPREDKGFEDSLDMNFDC